MKEIKFKKKISNFPSHYSSLCDSSKFLGLNISSNQFYVNKSNNIHGINASSQIRGNGNREFYISISVFIRSNGYNIVAANSQVLSISYDDMSIEMKNLIIKNGCKDFDVDIDLTQFCDTEPDFEQWLLPVTEENGKTIFENLSENDGIDIDELETIRNCYGSFKIPIELIKKGEWAFYRKRHESLGLYEFEFDFFKQYFINHNLAKQIIKEDKDVDNVRYVAGIDLAYDAIEQLLVASVVIYDCEIQQVVEELNVTQDVLFTYVPRLYGFLEVPLIQKAIENLKFTPNLLLCNFPGMDHPQHLGTASELGLKTDIPSISCTTFRLVSFYDKENFGKHKFAQEAMIWDGVEVGKAIRMEENINPLFVNIGHKVSIETSINWVKKLTSNTIEPVPLEKAKVLSSRIVKKRFEFDILQDKTENCLLDLYNSL